MFARSIADAACILSLFACASSNDEAVASGDQAATGSEVSCGASYGPANESYKAAVAGAKAHKIDHCGGEEGGDLGTIAELSLKAVSTCGAFANVIKTSQWAAPIREELGDSLVLPFITGDLKVKDDSGKVVFSGLQAALEKGVVLWGPSPGAYGPSGNIKFLPNGKAIAGAQVWPEDPNSIENPHWETSDASWSLGEVVGDAVRITIQTKSGEKVYELRAVMWDSRVPDFEVREVGASLDGVPAFTAYISECDA
jgi:hypothetical protein